MFIDDYRWLGDVIIDKKKKHPDIKYIVNDKYIKFGIKYNFEKRRRGGDIIANKDCLIKIIWNKDYLERL